MTRRSAEPTVYTVAPGEPFLSALARAVLDGSLPGTGSGPPDPVTLVDYRVMVPTRRAARALIDVFLEASGGGAQLLPRITPLGDVDEDELMLSGAPVLGPDAQELDIGPAISPLQRRLLLTRFILEWARGDDPAARSASIHTPAQAALLAADLARLIDMFETEGPTGASSKAWSTSSSPPTGRPRCRSSISCGSRCPWSWNVLSS